MLWPVKTYFFFQKTQIPAKNKQTKQNKTHTVPYETVTAQCALECRFADVLWGHTPSEQKTIDDLLLASLIWFMLCSLVVFTNHCMDIKRSKDTFCQRPLLFQIPVIISIFYFIVGFEFLLPFIVGKENILCSSDVNGKSTLSCLFVSVFVSVCFFFWICVSFFSHILFFVCTKHTINQLSKKNIQQTVVNPSNGYITPCFFFGSIFSGAIITIGLYTTLFSFALLCFSYFFYFFIFVFF